MTTSGLFELLSATDDRRRERVVLAYERYGRGKSVAFPVQDSWMWQMHATIRVEDQTHENFWRQMLRWLVADVPSAVEASTTTDRVEPGEAVTVEAAVVDPTWVELNDAHVVAHVTRPGGSTIDVPLQWTGQRDGQYRGTFVSTVPGAYRRPPTTRGADSLRAVIGTTGRSRRLSRIAPFASAPAEGCAASVALLTRPVASRRKVTSCTGSLSARKPYMR